MLRNYLLIALRTVRKHKVYSFINVFGLAVGMACCLLILTFVSNEWTYDTFHEDADAVYRVHIHALTPEGNVDVKAGQPYPLAPTLADELPEVAHAVRLQVAAAVVQVDGGDAFEERVLFTEPSFFDVFTFPLAAGQRTATVHAPDAVVLTTAAAQKYFGEADPRGKRLRISLGSTFEEFVVTAVAATPPANSSITFDILLPLERAGNYTAWRDAWTSWVTNTYVRLHRADQAAALADKLPAFVAQHYGPMVQTWRILQWLSEEEGAFQLALQPLREVHFAPYVQQAQTQATDPAYPLLLTGLALAILLIACINFTTLAVGQAAQRAKEVSLRKVMGAVRGQLMKQFWGEAVLLSLLALLLGLALTEALLPVFKNVTGQTQAISYPKSGTAVLVLLGLVLGTGLVAGAYPAVYLSRFQPIEALKRGLGGRRNNRWMQVLVVVQFSLSIVLIAGVLVISGQLRYMKNQHRVFDGDQVVVIPTHRTDRVASEQLAETFKNEVRHHPNVLAVTHSSTGFDRSLSWNSYSTDDGAYLIYTNRIDPDFIETFNMDITAGRGFSDDFAGDVQQSVVVNEALVRAYGWEDPIGQPLEGFTLVPEEGGSPTVIGVVKDYPFKSLHHAIEPMALFLAPRDDVIRYLYVRLRPAPSRQGDRFGATLAALETTWKRLDPNHPFTSYFLDDDLDRMYRTEVQWQRLITYAAFLAILIACMGLFGLASFTAERRRKEIGIRKVLGASVSGVTLLLSRQYLKLVVLANVIAWPVAFYLLTRWLDRFAYHIAISGWIFVTAGLVALLVALFSVGYQAVRAALTDPVKSLRYE